MRSAIDINADLGESTYSKRFPLEAELFPYLSSCNIACGFHGGDPIFIEEAIQHALQHGIRIGAHPSYPDRATFGRQPMDLSVAELKAVLKYQIGALKTMVESRNGTLSYVKPHGALYHVLCADNIQAKAAVAVCTEIDPKLAVMGLPDAALEAAAQQAGLEFIREGFADRRYTNDGSLVSRKEADALLSTPEAVAEQVKLILTEGMVRTNTGQRLSLEVDSLCIHGDHQNAVQNLMAIDQLLGQLAIHKGTV